MGTYNKRTMKIWTLETRYKPGTKIITFVIQSLTIKIVKPDQNELYIFLFFFKRPIVGAAFLLVLLGSAFADGDDVDGGSCLLLLSIFFCNTMTIH